MYCMQLWNRVVMMQQHVNSQHLFRNCMQHIWVILRKAANLLKLLINSHDSKIMISFPYSFEVYNNDLITVQFFFFFLKFSYQLFDVSPRWIGVLWRFRDYRDRMPVPKSLPVILQKYQISNKVCVISQLCRAFQTMISQVMVS